ncbi:MAG: T9SS type A sorting domain-containing protein [Patescibacteria group bacterium]|nr:T9SS type A sorting domain-containing protein [Patescibacteria group bacterium]
MKKMLSLLVLLAIVSVRSYLTFGQIKIDKNSAEIVDIGASNSWYLSTSASGVTTQITGHLQDFSVSKRHGNNLLWRENFKYDFYPSKNSFTVDMDGNTIIAGFQIQVSGDTSKLNFAFLVIDPNGEEKFYKVFKNISYEYILGDFFRIFALPVVAGDKYHFILSQKVVSFDKNGNFESEINLLGEEYSPINLFNLNNKKTLVVFRKEEVVYDSIKKKDVLKVSGCKFCVFNDSMNNFWSTGLNFDLTRASTSTSFLINEVDNTYKTLIFYGSTPLCFEFSKTSFKVDTIGSEMLMASSYYLMKLENSYLLFLRGDKKIKVVETTNFYDTISESEIQLDDGDYRCTFQATILPDRSILTAGLFRGSHFFVINLIIQRPPGKIDFIEINTSSFNALISWVDPPDGGATISAYEVGIKEDTFEWNYYQINSKARSEELIGNLKPETSYEVVIRSINLVGSAEFSDVVRFITNDISIGEKTEELKIYPNPVKDYLFVPKGNYELIDVNGKTINKFISVERINLEDLLSGIYFLKNNFNQFARIVKN